MLNDFTLRRSAIVSLQRFFVKDIKSRYHIFFTNGQNLRYWKVTGISLQLTLTGLHEK